MLRDHGGNDHWEKPGASNANTERRLMSSGKPRAVDNMHSSYKLSNLCFEQATCSST